MLYNLILVVFVSGGGSYKVPLSNDMSSDSCYDTRDYVRGGINYLNNLDEPVFYECKEVEFVDSECVAQKVIY